MHTSLRVKVALAVALLFFAIPDAEAIPIRSVVSEVFDRFANHSLGDVVLDAAKSLFWTLALISLVWTMGMLIVRQDIGEMLMELLRFIIVTGIFYWLLINASTRQGGEGFVDAIVNSFLNMANTDPTASLTTNANNIFRKGMNVFYHVVVETADGDEPDRILSGGIATVILVLCALISAQVLLALVMAWVLAYAGIFLLGFGGARWTSQIAVNYYKHVIAVGIALLALSIIGAVGAILLEELKYESTARADIYSDYLYLGLMLGTCIMMVVLSVKVPQLLYTLVTGSIMGLYSGSASAAGAAIASAGGAAYATAFGRSPGGGGAGPGGGLPYGGGSSGSGQHRAESVMDAVQRSGAAVSGMADPFHVHSGADPFGVQRAPDPHRGARGGSVFGNASVGSAPTAPVVDLPGGGGSAPEVAAPKSPVSSGTSRPGQGATRDGEAIQAASASSGAAGDMRADVGRPVEAGVDVAFDASDTARAAMDAIPRETQDLPGQGRSDSLQPNGGEDLRAHTRSTADTKVDTHIDARTDAKLDTHNAVSGNVPGLASNVTGPADVMNESLSHADGNDSTSGHDDVRTSGSRRTGANASAVQRATSGRPEDAMHETGMDSAQASASTSSMPHELNQSTSTTDTRIERTTADAPPESRVMGKERQAHVDTSSHMTDRMSTTEAMRSEGEIPAASSATMQVDAQVQTTTASTQVADGHKHARASNIDAPSTGMETAQPERHPTVHGDAGHAATLDTADTTVPDVFASGAAGRAANLASAGATAPGASTSGHIDTPHSERTTSDPSAARIVGIEPAVHTGATSSVDRETQTTEIPPPVGNQASPSRIAPTNSPDPPSTSLVQEDMQVAQPIGEMLEVVPGATVEAPPNVDVHAAAEPTAFADEPLPRQRKRRERHSPGEDPPTVPPPLDDEEHAGEAPP